ncbi:MAG: hypothetical protein JNM70_17140 [Anaerolineae bacterium]|nr:hypothetical protein [Anaerolineae bacterium]
MMRRLMQSVVIVMLIAVLFSGGVARAQDEDPVRQAVIDVVVGSEEFADWLGNYPNYQVNTWGPDENNVWGMEFLNESGDEWLGYASIDADTLEIQDSFVPKPLPQDVYQAQLAIVTDYVLHDAEVLGWLENPDRWEMYPDWNRWEQVWDVGFYRGIEGVVVKATVDENDNVWIDKIVDPNQLSEEEALRNARDEAINLAYSAEGVWDALDGYDEWTSYAEQQGRTRWSISFVVDEEERFFALVDIELNTVLETRSILD